MGRYPPPSSAEKIRYVVFDMFPNSLIIAQILYVLVWGEWNLGP